MVNPEDQFEFASGVRLGKAISHGGNGDWEVIHEIMTHLMLKRI